MENFKKIFYDLKTKAEEKRDRSQIIAKLSYDIYMETRPDVKDKICLDIGIGSGWAMHSILANGAKHCDGIDISIERIRQADDLLKKKGFSNYTLKVGDAENLIETPSDNYDYINYIDILEHLQNYEKGIYEIHRVLKPGGIVYIKTPNNFTDHDLKLHYYGQMLCSLIMPELIIPPGEDHLMLRDDTKRLTEEERNRLEDVIPEGFHEHMHQFYPDELYNLMTKSGFKVRMLSGIPLFSDILFNNESHLENVSRVYTDFIKSGIYNVFIDALLQDIKTSKYRSLLDSLPANYVFSDNMIIVAQKI